MEGVVGLDPGKAKVRFATMNRSQMMQIWLGHFRWFAAHPGMEGTRAWPRKFRRAMSQSTLLLLLFTTPVTSQARIVVDGHPACRDCFIQLDRIAVLGTAEGPASLAGRLRAVTVDSEGLIYLSTEIDASHIKVFDGSGRYVRTIGRHGEGPGEFGFVWELAARDREIHAFDSDLLRQTVFSPTGIVLRSTRIPRPLGVVVVDESTAIVNSMIASSDLAGIPLHVVNERGEMSQSFGDRSISWRADQPLSGWRELAIASSTSVWAAHKTRYVVEEWNLDGSLKKELVRPAEWFVETNRPRLFQPNVPPPANIGAIRRDKSGRLWVLVTVPDPEWRSALILDADHPDGPQYTVTDLNDYFDTVIEVLDPDAGRLYVQGRSDTYLESFATDEIVASSRETPDGVPQVLLWRLKVGRNP